MPKIFFKLAEGRNKFPKLGIGPSFQSFLPLPTARWGVSGVTKDSTGTPLAGCVVKLFLTATDRLVAQTVSDGGGYYAFSVGPAQLYYAVSYLVGSPDVAGTSVHTLVGA
jgi:hypothetical protein